MDVFQIQKQIQLLVGISKGVKQEYAINSLMPPSSRGFYESLPEWDECDMFEKVMDCFSDYIKENEKLFIRNIELTEGLINTVIVVKENKIYVSAKDSDLLNMIKTIAKKNNYDFAEQDRNTLLSIKIKRD
jgi:hypothetical protein